MWCAVCALRVALCGECCLLCDARRVLFVLLFVVLFAVCCLLLFVVGWCLVIVVVRCSLFVAR